MTARAVGWALVLYGMAGMALVVLGALAGLGMAAQLEELSLRADSTLGAAERAADATATSFAGVDDTLAEAQGSATGAAALARNAAATLDGLSVAMSINILGAQPLRPLAAQFAESADQADALAETLDAVGASFSDTRTDMAAIAVQLELLADELGRLRDSSGAAGEAPPIRLFVTMVVAWLALQALGAVAAGVFVLRGRRPSAPVGV